MSGKRAKALRRQSKLDLEKLKGFRPMYRDWRRYYRQRKKEWTRTPRDIR